MGNVEVAETILKQLAQGPTGRLKVMIGGHSFVAGDNYVSFGFKAKAKNGANYCKVTLDASDTYTVEFTSVRKTKGKILPVFTPKGEFEGVYNDGLKGLFERETGLYLSL